VQDHSQDQRLQMLNARIRESKKDDDDVVDADFKEV
jgi:hypothetical protein